MTALIVALVVIGASLVIAEAHVPSYGLLGLSGIAAFAVAGVLAVGAAGGSALLAFALVVPVHNGDVLVHGERWRARGSILDDEPVLHDGDQVVVEQIQGLTLSVRRAEEWEVL